MTYEEFKRLLWSIYRIEMTWYWESEYFLYSTEIEICNQFRNIKTLVILGEVE